jgi:hypothetical protein
VSPSSRLKVALVTTLATVAWVFLFIVLSEALAVLLLIVVGVAALVVRRTRLSH